MNFLIAGYAYTRGGVSFDSALPVKNPELGLSRAIDPWTLEFAAATIFYSDNHDFFNGLTRSQNPGPSTEGHVIHGFGSRIWTDSMPLRLQGRSNLCQVVFGTRNPSTSERDSSPTWIRPSN
ncbi:MAG: hypothetical protein IPI44_10210 [Sulfuritalea sp.]|nr:hypothetical protein [Sulfuritalea sp.]